MNDKEIIEERKKVSELAVGCKINRYTILDLGEELTNIKVKSRLSEYMAKFIVDNFDNLPCEYNIRHDDMSDAEEYDLRFLLISKKEYNRLKQYDRGGISEGL